MAVYSVDSDAVLATTAAVRGTIDRLQGETSAMLSQLIAAAGVVDRQAVRSPSRASSTSGARRSARSRSRSPASTGARGRRPPVRRRRAGDDAACSADSRRVARTTAQTTARLPKEGPFA